MGRPRKADETDIDAQIEEQTRQWVRVSLIAAKIATIQSEGFLKQVQDGGVSTDTHLDIAQVMEHIVDGAGKAIAAGTKLIAARKNDAGVTGAAPSEEELAAELTGSAG